MSVIAIVIDERKIKPTALVQLHKALNQPLQTLKSLCNEGNPILEIEVFEGDFQEKLKTIRSVLEIVSGEKIAAKFYEIPYEEKYAENMNLDKLEVTANFVNSMLNAADEEFERQSKT